MNAEQVRKDSADLLNQISDAPSELLEANNGYNPEVAYFHGNVAEDGADCIKVTDESGDKFYFVIDSKNLTDHITRYPGMFALYYNGKFYA